MARGCPPVVADCSAMPESLGDAGLLASPGDPTSFAEKVIAIHDSPELRNRLVERGHERIKGFTWTACGQQFAELFEQLTQPER